MRYTFFSRDFYVPKGSVKVEDKNSDAVAYINQAGKRLQAVVFFGKQNKPVANNTFRTEEERSREVARLFSARQASISYKKAIRNERKAYVPDYKVGDILYTCWGYDQTNIDYFQVVDARGKFVWLRQIG